MAYRINPDKCITCGMCAEACPVNTIAEGAPFSVIPQNCIECGACDEACPVGAVELPEGSLYFNCTVEAVEDLTHDIKRVYMHIDGDHEINFQSGQFAHLVIPGYTWTQVESKVGPTKSVELKEGAKAFNKRMGHDQAYNMPESLKTKGEVNVPVKTYRAYSMSGRASDKKHIEMMIRLVPGGSVTTYVHSILEKGAKVECIGPLGHFYLQHNESTMICVAGGSGKAPIRSILHEIEEKKITNREIWYFFGAVGERDLYLLEELKALEKKMPNFHFIPVLSGDAPNWKGEKGLVTEAVDRFIKNGSIKKPKEGFEGYLCGSPGMINACVKTLKDNGIAEEKIFFDNFG